MVADGSVLVDDYYGILAVLGEAPVVPLGALEGAVGQPGAGGVPEKQQRGCRIALLEGDYNAMYVSLHNAAGDEAAVGNAMSAVFEHVQLDACQYPGFERVAGGEDSLSQLFTRFRNRYLCKYVWKPQKFKSIACTGCGRCIESCLGKINKNELFLELLN